MNKNKIIFSIIFSIFFVLSISTYYNSIKQKEYIKLKQEQSFDVMQQMIDGKIIFFRKQFAARIKNIINKKDNFKKALLNNHQEDIKNIMNKVFKILKKENKYSKTLHLISNQNISIYRAHKPNQNGDNLTQIRPIVNYVNKYKKAKYGFEAGHFGMVYRVTVPIIYNNIHYGVLEYGIDTNLFVDDLTSVSNYIESAVLINKEYYKQLEIKGIELVEKPNKYFSKFILFDNDNFFDNINIDKIKDGLSFTNNKEHYIPFLYDLLTFKANSVGKILIAVNVTADKNRYLSMIKLSIINLIILILTIFAIVYYAFSYYEKKIYKLKEHEKQNERILHQQSKMASMGEMIGNIAHQWRQPLSTISTVASGITVQKEYDIFDETTLVPSMNNIISQTEHMSKTIDDFRDFFKSDKDKIAFDLNNVLEQNIILIESSCKNHNINIIKEYSDGIKLIGFQNELTQAILNILNNSKDQLLKLANEELKIIKIETKKYKNTIELVITDNGGGIDDEIVNKIFEPYFTTKHKSQGTGIGLYMTHEIIVKHFHGDLVASNVIFTYKGDEYKGACFTVTLPLSLID